MALSEEDKQRIREEEAYRLQVRQGLDRTTAKRTFVLWLVLVGISVLLWLVIRFTRYRTGNRGSGHMTP